MSKIIRLDITNYKIAKAIEITPNGSIIPITGRNGQGKSTVLDAITAALGGVNAKTTPRPIRDGEDRAEIVLETEDLVVTRTFTPGGSRLTVKSQDGATYSKGQAKLDDMLGRLSLDPLAFTQLPDKEQLATLLELVDLPFDPAALDAERRAVFAARTDVNRRIKELQAQAAAIPVTPEMAGMGEVSVSALLAEYREAEESFRAQRQAHDRLDGARARVAKLEQLLADARRAVEAAAAETAKYDSVPVPDLAAIQQKIDNAEQINQDVRTFQSWVAASDALTAAQEEAAKLTGKLDAIDTTKTEGLATAEFPVEGLGFDEDGVTYQGVPFKQASSAEQLRVSLAMAIAANPALRVIRIADGSLLDDDNLALIKDMAEAYDYQIWLEKVGADSSGYIIEDGVLV